jgi:hypothetical protein
VPRKYTVSAAVIERNKKASQAANSIDSYVQRVVNRAGELKPEHIEKLRALLPPVPRNEGGKAA